ncbi:MAG: hypothetical protein Q8L60_07730 [Gammaproteobacteria bacterium]|nr:hypothetical protein [Gammaproteobacteria bacterium]MDP2142149.1 hypothetical protein [Gammaproteobacteria bacterium]MDP2348243.1 hypothetical protein [Gammaproteobacteria bacterium]
MTTSDALRRVPFHALLHSLRHFSRISALVAILCWPLLGEAQDASEESAAVHPIVGTWTINEQLSDDPDEQVEAAIIAAGGRVERRWFGRKEKGRYRGGPEEHELYDRISYDEVLRIDYDEPEFWFGYADGYQRVFHMDGRTQVIGANDHYSNGAQDFSFGDWEEDTLIVEARPRDGGFTMETYTLEANNTRLRVELRIKPGNFGAPIRMTRVYDRQPD